MQLHATSVNETLYAMKETLTLLTLFGDGEDSV